jgi:hypothetical protein
MQNGLPHAVRVLRTLSLALSNVDIGDNFLPSSFHVQFGQVLFVFSLFANVLLSSFDLLALFLGKELLKPSFAFFFPLLLILPFLLLI